MLDLIIFPTNLEMGVKNIFFSRSLETELKPWEVNG